jgi:hypothetical protein
MRASVMSSRRSPIKFQNAATMSVNKYALLTGFVVVIEYVHVKRIGYDVERKGYDDA